MLRALISTRSKGALAAGSFVCLTLGSLYCSAAQAINLDLDVGSGLGIRLNSFATLGAAWRLEDRAEDLLGKSSLNPQACGTREVDGQSINFNSCQGVHQLDTLPAGALVASPGQFSRNADDGNWNFARGDMIQAPLKLIQDLSVSYEDYGLFGRWMWFHDFVNHTLTEYHPNRVAAGSSGTEPPALPGLLPASYGAGEAYRQRRADPEALRQLGSDFQLLDAYAYAFLPLPGERELSLKIGRQTLNWGESTLLVVNSLNQVNPLNVNNLWRTGYFAEEVFTPVEMIVAGTSLTEQLSVEAWWQWRWQAAEIPAPGSFYSTLDLGSNDLNRYIHIGFGGNPEDPGRHASPLNNPLSLLTDTTTTGLRQPDGVASHEGQWGVSLRYFADNFGNGTDIGFYFMNYHSKLPYASFFASDLSCARTHPLDNGTGSATGQDANSLLSLVAACPNLPAADLLLANLAPLDGVLDSLGELLADLGGLQALGTGPVSDAVPIDTVQVRLDYPEDIQVWGISFNTSLGDWGVQGELAYRPNLPLQVDAEDLVFAALGPMLTSCHRHIGTANACGGANGDPLSQSGPNTFNLLPATGQSAAGDGGDAPSVQRSFPSFIMGYRGLTVGEVEPNSYIPGFERAKVLQYNLGGTYTLGRTANPIGADQVLLIMELGATQILNMPEHQVLQIEAPGTFRHASAGAVDDTASASSRQDAPGCFPRICVDGPDGLRFNPQQETLSHTTAFSWGYRAIMILRYGNILPGINLEPMLVWGHDVEGYAPGPGENFVQGRKSFMANIETRLRNAWSFNLGYAMWSGGGRQNLLRDRDLAQVFVKYQF